jgi:F-type H+-transporting ATPase subunit delta
LADSSTTSIDEAAHRYAAALFDLSLQAGSLDQVDSDLKALAKTIGENPDLCRALASPLFKAEEKSAVLAAIGARLGFSELTRRFVGVTALNRRSPQLVQMAGAFSARLARHRGEVRVVARVAAPMTPKQAAEIEGVVSASLGRSVSVDVEVDPALIGGLQLQIGSRLIDASIRNKLNALTNLMKGA